MSLLLELGLETHPQYTKGKKIQQLSGPNISTFSGDLPSLSIFALIDLHHFISKVSMMTIKKYMPLFKCLIPAKGV